MSTMFNAYASYYDLLYKDKDYASEAGFIIKLLVDHQIRSDATILELGCGTGKHAKLLADNGYKVHGIDLSQEMINFAKQIDHYNLEFQLGDVRSTRLNKQFDVVISLFHVASYQITNEDLLAMFETVSLHLKPGGLFIFDCWYGPGVLTDRPAVRIKRMKNDEIEVLRTSEPVLYPEKNQVDVKFMVQITKDGKLLDTIHENHSMRYLFVPEIALMLKLNGIEMINTVEWMTENETGFDTWIATFINRKQR